MANSLSRFVLLFLVLCGCTPSPDPTVEPSDLPFGIGGETYSEPYRPQLHFSPRAHWMNDPNGMVYLDGEYHLFFQHYPDSTVWGPMHWGHAVSQDMLHWEELPIALYPDSLGYIFSGSAVVDHDNTSGLGQDGNPPLIAIFTHHDPAGEAAGRTDYQYQSLAYSNDRGRSWTKYAGNPVVPNTEKIRDFRDPKVRWDEASGSWLMVFAAQDRVKFYRSPNLLDWTYLSDFGMTLGDHGGVWECPDFFPIEVAGEGLSKWVLLLSINPGAPNGGSGTQYFVGDFDGTAFTLEEKFAGDVADNQGVWLDYGRDDYAGVTFSDIPAGDGRRLFMGWMSNWDYGEKVPTKPWRSAMTLPRTLTLHSTPAGYRIYSQPVAELAGLRSGTRKISAADTALTGVFPAPATAPDGEPRPLIGEMELAFVLQEGAGEDIGVELYNEAGERYRIGFDGTQQAYYSDRSQAGDAAFSESFAAKRSVAPRLADSDTVRLHLIVDVASVELFADGGASVMTEVFFPNSPFTGARVYGAGRGVQFLGGSGSALASIWKK